MFHITQPWLFFILVLMNITLFSIGADTQRSTTWEGEEIWPEPKVEIFGENIRDDGQADYDKCQDDDNKRDRLDRDDHEFGTRRELSSIDALNKEICGNGNFPEWTKKLNSFACTRSSSNGTSQRKAGHMRIAGGYFPALGDFPSMVQLKYQSGMMVGSCGGVIIHNDLVLTAAHCSYGYSANQGYIIAGTLSADNRDGRGVKVRLAGQCISPNYNPRRSTSDWAVLMLAQPLTYSNSIQPACIDFWRPPAQNVACVVAGFGLELENVMARQQRGSVMSPCTNVRQLTAPVGTTCYQRFPRKESYSANTCKGDSGSPIYCFDNCSSGQTKMYAVATLTSGTQTVCSKNLADYSYFTEIYKQGQSGMYQAMEKCISAMRSEVERRRRMQRMM